LTLAAVGFYMERAGYEEPSLKRVAQLGMGFDFAPAVIEILGASRDVVADLPGALERTTVGRGTRRSPPKGASNAGT
jgi:hypothetical protein